MKSLQCRSNPCCARVLISRWLLVLAGSARRSTGFELHVKPSRSRAQTRRSISPSSRDTSPSPHSYRNLASYRSGQGSSRASTARRSVRGALPSFRSSQGESSNRSRDRSPSMRRRYSLFRRRPSFTTDSRSTTERSRDAGFIGVYGRVDNLSTRDEHNGALGTISHYDVRTTRTTHPPRP